VSTYQVPKSVCAKGKFGHFRSLEQHIDVCDKLVRYDALVVVSKGMKAVKLSTNKILQFLTEGAG